MIAWLLVQYEMWRRRRWAARQPGLACNYCNRRFSSPMSVSDLLQHLASGCQR